MKYFFVTNTKIITLLYLCTCFISPALAEDQRSENKITEQNRTAETKEPEIKEPVATTPQPPIIDEPSIPGYGPGDANVQATNTPQPPKIDETSEPSYEAPIEQILSDTALDENSNIDSIKATDEEPVAKPASSHNTIWSETRPDKVSADWLQLTSGEWLRGRIIVMQKEKLEFDSDELNNLDIDWEKVKYIKSSEPYSLRFDGRAQATGTIEITHDKVNIFTDYDDQTFNRSDLLSIASGHETEISKWTNKITFSFNIRRGNTDQTDFTSKMSAKRRTINSRLLLDYLGNFTEVENTETINNHRINATFDIFLTRHLFLTPATMEFFRDPFQNIETRKNIGVAIGHTLINNNKSEWDISGGPSYQETKFVSVQPDESSKDTTATLILNTRFDTELNSKVDLEGTYTVTLGDNKTGGYTHYALLTIETELTKKLDFDVTGVWDRVRNPVQAADGTFPEQDDFRILIGLGYDL